ncbi:hypothetical protein GN244_ATG12034 [Phytophthora infestans]|uniref:Uncharacterized protein n=1 Tax=Phytophthora infestans TaxID=4787 RepID=A0A833T0M6_PHYIN|nr:hypothetical protein GN244_ATG12034 [Phytophthora infestans]KAF4133233.1 hypothetical protein GN958_ATG17579 [Phytophthora infestans]
MYSSWSIDKQCDIVEVIQAGAPENLHRDYQQTEYAAAIEKHEWVQSTVMVALHSSTKLLVLPESMIFHARISNLYLLGYAWRGIAPICHS